MEQAAAISPGNARVQRELAQAREAAQVAKSAATMLPKGHTLLRVAPYPIKPGADLWLVLSGNPGKGPLWNWPTYSNCRLTLVRRRSSSLTHVWRSDVGRGYTGGDLNDVQIFAFDMTGDGVAEAVASGVLMGADWAPSHTDIFEWQRGRMVKILGTDGDDWMTVRDLHHDGRPAQKGSRAVSKACSLPLTGHRVL